MMDEQQGARLMVAAQDGDGVAYSDLLRGCVGFIRSVGGDLGVAPFLLDDLVQDVLLALHRGRHTYDSLQPFMPWLLTIAQRRSIDLLRRTSRQRQRERHLPNGYDQHPDPGLTAAQAIALEDEGRHLRSAVAQLPDGQRQAVELLGLRELTLEEAANLTGRNKTALKVNLHRGLKSLRYRFQDDA